MGTSRPLKSHKHRAQGFSDSCLRHCGSWSPTGFSHASVPSLQLPSQTPSVPSASLQLHRRLPWEKCHQPPALVSTNQGRGCLLSSSLTPVCFQPVSTHQLLQCSTLMQPLEEQQREDVLVKQGQWGTHGSIWRLLPYTHVQHPATSNKPAWDLSFCLQRTEC